MWQVGSNGAGVRHWFIWCARYEGNKMHRNVKGNIVRYANRESAQRVADRLNAQ